ncbi:signal transduction histidine kinase [Gracilibacillus halotolerans]|uniref:histidine kinase n=1 Tax=Gracilibacillus halotolerans TaxID=74386 RepID=A0A841RNV2_9BACI|nr:HAMP domain-containing sensor histidine kinase [Gracilibacillus halotolerans]MBB6512348.1 signal transduction histidine kinase [Gracilibacillus halotolerans]
MKLRRRIALHFSFQFIVSLIFAFLFFIFLLILLANLVSKMELDYKTVDGLMDTITTVTIIDDNEVTLEENLEQQLIENDIWMQIVNKEGKVIHATNEPATLSQSYTTHELLLIDETKKIDNYTVRTFFDTWLYGNYYFLFGYHDTEKEMLTEWFHLYSGNGLVKQENLPLLGDKLAEMDGSIQVFQGEQLAQTIGDTGDEIQEPLELLTRKYEPGRYSTRVSVFNDPATDTTWILHFPGEKTYHAGWLFPSEEIQMIVIAVVSSLVLALLISIWNGYRYGQPLLLFVNWLERMGKEQYNEMFTEKERKKIFKKKGKTRHRYRLYQEVIQSFYQMTKKLDRTQQERKRLERTREEWMVGISHDLRTPLSTIQGYGHLLESNKYPFTPEELQEIGKVVREKGDYMVQLVNDFSLVFQLKNSAIQLEKLPVNLNEFARSAVVKFERDLTLRTVSFSFTPSSDEPKAAIDSKWFVRVLDNIIYNAVTHNPPGTNIAVTVLHEQNNAFIEISDNGKGMEEEFIENLFERYYRGTNTSERTEGAGLGMSIAKEIVELHGGEIQVHSTVGKGTTVKLLLPLIE